MRRLLCFFGIHTRILPYSDGSICVDCLSVKGGTAQNLLSIIKDKGVWKKNLIRFYNHLYYGEDLSHG